MTRATRVDRFTVMDPGDPAAVAAAIAAGRLDPDRIVAVIGKTPGNGLVNDFTRGYLARSLAALFARTGTRGEDAILAEVPFVFSGGVEGVLTPHVAVISVDPAERPALKPAGPPRLAVGVARARRLDWGDLCGAAQIAATAEAVAQAMGDAALQPADVRFVQVKAPCLTMERIAAAREAGTPPVTDSPGQSMALSRVAAAFGVARALGEVPADRLTPAAMLADRSVWSAVASTSSGVEVTRTEVIVLGRSADWGGTLDIATEPMADALDAGAVARALRTLGMTPGPALQPEEAARIAAVFVKGEAARDGLIRGQPHTMLDDGDIDPQRHIRAALGGLVGGILGDTRLFVSGGAEHQGPDGGGLISVVARANEPA